MAVNLMPALIGLDSEGGIVHIEAPRKDETWFFLGDIHGDPECLKWTFRYIQGFKGFQLCLLGDVFDRGDDEADCFEMILRFSNKHPGQVMWLAGNHDRPVGENHTQAGWPSELIDLRNELMPRLPFMALFPGGTIAMHGGPPSASRLGQENYQNPVITPEIRGLMQQSRFVDFKDSEEDTNLDHWFDWNDLLAFVDFLKLPCPLRMLIRGHDHPLEGFHLHSDSSVEILTLLGSSKIGVQFMPDQHRDWTTLAQFDASGQFSAKRIFHDGTYLTASSWQ